MIGPGPLPIEVVVRGMPSAHPRPAPPAERWPDHALVMTYQTARPGGGPLTYGMGRLLGPGLDPKPSWSFHGRSIRASAARRFFGPGSLPLEDFFEEAVFRSVYKPPLRAGLVTWSVPHFISSAAERVDARHGSYRFTLWTYVGQDGVRRPDRFRPRIRVAPSSGGRAAIGFDARKSPDPQDFVVGPDGKRTQYRGRFLTLHQLGYVLTGDDQLTPDQALRAWGIPKPGTADGVDGLARELDALCRLYEAMLEDLAFWPGSPVADRLGSPVALAKVSARKALGHRLPDERPGISRRAKAAALSGHLGGRSEVDIRHQALPVALSDGIAAYPATGELLGTGRWPQAERIEQRHLRRGHGLEGFVRWLLSLTVADLLTKPGLWRELAGVAFVEPDGDLLAVRGRAFQAGQGLGAETDETLLAPIAAGSQPIWEGLPDVVASKILTGRLPRMHEAYTWTPVGVPPGAKSVTLPGGVVWDPHLERRFGSRFPTLVAALAEIGLRSKDGTLRGLDQDQQDRVGTCAKNARNGIAYGVAVEYNPSNRTHPMWGGTGRGSLGVVGATKEEPGELVDPPVGMLATSGERLVLAILEHLVAEAGGSIMFMDTDSAAIVATPDGGELLAVPGGPHVDAEGRECVLALSFDQVVVILDRFRPLALATELSLPAFRVRRDGDGFRMQRTNPSRANLLSLFKVTSECIDDGRWVRTEALSVSTKRYVPFRRDEHGRPISIKPSGHVLGTLANFRLDGVVDWDGPGGVARAWEFGLGLLGAGPDADPKDLGIDLSQPVLQPFVARDPRDFLALGTSRFTVDRPDGIRPFEELLVPVPVGRGRGRIVAPAEPNAGRWRAMIYTDAKGRPFRVGTIASVTRGIDGLGASRDQGVVMAQDLASWLGSYFTRPVSGAVGPDGETCSSETKGMLATRPVRVVRVHVAGAEPHRRRDEEAVLGWDVQLAQDVPGRSRICVGCGSSLAGRARRWCTRCRRRSGVDRTAWKRPTAKRTCGCGCGEEAEKPHLYLNEAHRHRAKRARARIRSRGSS